MHNAGWDSVLFMYTLHDSILTLTPDVVTVDRLSLILRINLGQICMGASRHYAIWRSFLPEYCGSSNSCCSVANQISSLVLEQKDSAVETFSLLEIGRNFFLWSKKNVLIIKPNFPPRPLQKTTLNTYNYKKLYKNVTTFKQ